jgi:hypothetical protein
MNNSIVATFALIYLTGTASATSYYVDSGVTGNDSNNGIAVATPWHTLAKVNSVVFQPGDTIMFAAGGQWGDGTAPTMLWPKGSGNSSCSTGYIKIDMYGTGPKPKIVGAGAGAATGSVTSQGAVYLKDQSCWEIRNLDVTNSFGGSTAPVQLVGIKVENSLPVAARHIYIGNNTVHDVTGVLNGFYGNNAGIAVTADMNTANPCPNWPSQCPANPAWTDVTIENNVITSVDRTGVYVGVNYQDPASDIHAWTLFTRNDAIRIRGNVLDHIGGDGILTIVARDVLIENNTVSNSGSRIIATRNASGCTTNSTTYANCNSAGVWTAVTDGSTLQFNEVYNYALPLPGGATQWDGEAFDSDQGTTNQTIQFNYSHNNQGGMLLTCEPDGPTGALAISGQIVRFNVSYNDVSGGLSYTCGNGTLPAGAVASRIENNLFVTAGVANKFLITNSLSLQGGIKLRNNIFYVRSGSGSFPTLDYSNSVTQVSNNIYFGRIVNIPSDSAAQTTDPLMVQPEAAGIGAGALDGLKLATGSPAFLSGLNTATLGTLDFWANVIPAAPNAVNRGPYNGGPLTRGKPNIALGATATLAPNTSYEAEGWGTAKVTDGRRDSSYSTSEGVSSQAYSSAANTVDLIIQLPGIRTFSQIVLFPRDDDGWIGGGFPVDFTIDVWTGASWLTRVTKVGYKIPMTGQAFTWSGDTTDRIRIHATKLGNVPTYGYFLQLAEVEVY